MEHVPHYITADAKPEGLIYGNRAPHRAEAAVAGIDFADQTALAAPKIFDADVGTELEVTVENGALLVRIITESAFANDPLVLLQAEPIPLSSVQALIDRKPAPDWLAPHLKQPFRTFREGTNAD